MSNNIGGDTLTATMCTMTDMQEIEVADEYTKGFLGTEIGIDTAGNGWWPDNIGEWILAVVAIVVVIILVIGAFVGFTELIAVISVIGSVLVEAGLSIFAAGEAIFMGAEAFLTTMEIGELIAGFELAGESLATAGTTLTEGFSAVGSALFEKISIALGENGLNFLTSGLYERFAIFEEIGNGVYTFKNLYVAITSPLRVVDGVYGWVTNVPELYGDLKAKDLDEFITDSFDSIFKPSNPYNPMPNLSWDILHNHNEDMPSLDGIMGGDPKYV